MVESMTPEEYPHCQAAFINAISEEGTKEEAVRWLQKTWNEVCWLRKNQKQAVEEEREACAKVAEEYSRAYGSHNVQADHARRICPALATAIRSRGQG